MPAASKKLKTGLVVALILLATFIHYRSLHGNLAIHLVHRELFFLPIILAAFWFGTIGGGVSAVTVSLIYLPHTITYNDPHGQLATVLIQVSTFLVVGIILGWMVTLREKSNQKKLYLDELFGPYVPRKIRSRVLAGNRIPEESLRRTTILMVKINNLHAVVDKTTPWKIVTLLNEYFTKLYQTITESDGLIIGFSEDTFKIVFGAPVSKPEHQSIGIAAALKMRETLELINADFAEQGLPTLTQSIGVHSGLLLGAIIGCPSRKKYNVIGPTVSVAQLIRARCEQEGLDILVSDDVLSGGGREYNQREISPGLSHAGRRIGLNTVSSMETAAP